MQTTFAFLVLHVTRLKGLAEDDQIAVALRSQKEDVLAELDRLTSQNLVSHRSGLISGWSLTQQGREVHKLELANNLLGIDLASLLLSYEKFLPCNKTLLTIASFWQSRDDSQTRTTSDSRGYGNKPAASSEELAGQEQEKFELVQTRLADLGTEIALVLARVSNICPRFSNYHPRLVYAQKRFEAGETQWLTQTLIDSYHRVWMELHEDLIVTLSLRRT